MSLEVHPIRQIFARFFPKKYVVAPKEEVSWETLPDEEKKDLALHELQKGELLLLQGNLGALSLFETAARLDPESPEIWYRQGLSFFEYGSEEGQERALLLASKYFKQATKLSPSSFAAWVAWGNTLLQLGRFHQEHHFLIEAKEKYQKALELPQQPGEDRSELYWDYGTVWLEIARYSGEALDLRLALDSFQNALTKQPRLPPEFYKDFASAYLELGLLINDNRLHGKAIECLEKALHLEPQYCDGWVVLAECYAQLYLNTLDESLVTKASDCFAQATKLSPKDSEVWLSWAQILGESGRLTQNEKALRQSIEKCARAATLNPDNPDTIAQWVESLSLLGSKTGRLDLLVEAETKIIKATETFPDDPDLWHAYALCCVAFARYYEDAEYYEMAIEKLQIGLSMNRTSAEHWHTLANVHKLYAELTNHQDLLERANRFYARALDLKPSYPPLLFDAACTLLHFSELDEDFPSLEKAIQYFEILIQNYKEALLHHPEWIYEYACALEWLGDYTHEESSYTRAIELFTHVLLIDPDFRGIHHRIGLCYMELGHLSEEAEFYRRAIHFFRLSIQRDEENEEIWHEWGSCLIHLAHHTIDTEQMHQLYWEAEQKITKAGQLGASQAYYTLACLYSILGRTEEAMQLIYKALAAQSLPRVDEMLEDEWLENLCGTPQFAHFISHLEQKLQAREE